VYNHAPPDYVCPFCLLAAGRFGDGLYSTAEDIIYQDALVMAVIGSHQWPGNSGNTLIIPKEHFENLYDLPVRLAAPVHATAQAMAIAMKAAYGCAGVSTRQHNEPAGNQDVWHYHLHVTPRYPDDALYRSLGGHRTLMPPDVRADHAARIRACLPEIRY
jgi:histidine triad (HIT) family protein